MIGSAGPTLQKHAPARGNWARLLDPGRKPWFCKNRKNSHRNKSHVLDPTNSDWDDHLSLNTTLANCRKITTELIPVYDINAGVFVNSIMHFNQFDEQTHFDGSECQMSEWWD